MNVISIDLDEMKKSGLFPHEFMLLSIINEGISPDLYTWPDGLIQSMTENVWITKNEEGEYLLRSKAKVYFEAKENIINFDEFWDAFPFVTPSGRELRGQNKMWGKKLTDNYIESRKKYLQKVKSVEASPESNLT